jgi:hypothetical protein
VAPRVPLEICNGPQNAEECMRIGTCGTRVIMRLSAKGSRDEIRTCPPCSVRGILTAVHVV